MGNPSQGTVGVCPDRCRGGVKRVTRGIPHPDFETVTINVGDRDLVRKILRFDCDHDTRNGWIGRELPSLLEASALTDVDVQTGVVVFEPRSFSPYFLEIGHSAFRNHVISASELRRWQGEIHRLLGRDELFCTTTYFPVIGRLEA
jgi:hypothetical protein